jgi:integrase
LRSAVAYWRAQDGLLAVPTRQRRRRTCAPDRTRALSRTEVEHLFARDVPLREKTLWRMLYETAARAGEVLALDVEDLDLRNRRARVQRKGGAIDVIVWQTGSARLLPRLLAGHRTLIPVRGDVHSGASCSDKAVVSLHDLAGACARDQVREHVAERVPAIVHHSALQAPRSPVTMTLARGHRLCKRARYRV